jgi:hypothetical protein
MGEKPSADWWFGFCVRFVCGALLGLLLGLSLWGTFTYPMPAGWWPVPVCAVLFGAASGAWGDAFWEGPRYWLWFWP